MVIRIKDHVNYCYSNDDGKIIKDLILMELSCDNVVTLSFEGVRSITSSFTNTAFVELLDVYNFNYLKKNLRFIDSNKYINEMIKTRFNFEAKRRNHAELVNS